MQNFSKRKSPLHLEQGCVVVSADAGRWVKMIFFKEMGQKWSEKAPTT
jgi:hypothetical protein